MDSHTSSESGSNEVYVRAFPGGAIETGGKWAVSRGRFPNWSRDGRELFFLQGGRIMVAAYTAKGDSFVADPASVWSERLILRPGGSPFPPFALVRDEKRIAVVIDALEAEGQKPGTHIMFLLNFFDELRRRVPRRK